MRTTKYLGFIIEMNKNIIMDPAKIEVIIKWEIFKTVRRVQRFLKFYPKFIKNNSQLVMLLTNSIKKHQIRMVRNNERNFFETETNFRDCFYY